MSVDCRQFLEIVRIHGNKGLLSLGLQSKRQRRELSLCPCISFAKGSNYFQSRNAFDKNSKLHLTVY